MSTLSATETKTLYGKALALISADKPEEALQLLGRIVEANPRIAEVHYQIGRLFFAGDRYDRAVTHFSAAAALKPAEPAIRIGWAGAVALLGDPEAEAAFLKALKAAPLPREIQIKLQDRFGARRTSSKPITGGAPANEFDAAIALMSKRRFAEAEAQATALLARFPRSAAAANIRAAAQMEQGKGSAALASFNQAIQLDPDYTEAREHLGRLLMDRGRLNEAKATLREALALAPGRASALTAFGIALNKEGKPERALPFLERAISAAPKSAETLMTLGNSYTLLREYEKGEETLERAAEASSGTSPSIMSLLGQARARLGKSDAALADYDAALAVAPDHPMALANKAGLLQGLGRFDDAEVWFRKAFAADPKNGENYRLFLTSHKTKPGDPIIKQMESALADPATPDRDKVHLGFALAKAMEDLKDYKRVFTYLRPANQLMRKLHPYDIATRRAEVDGTLKTFADFDPTRLPSEKMSDYAPIFVTGMPRSGTTLVEQIIASHSRVTGAGEVGHAARGAYDLIYDRAGRKFRTWSEIGEGEIAALGRDYEAFMRDRFSDAIQVSDKSIQTYAFLGLIKLALPKSRIIVVRRDPRDTLLSIYKNLFVEGTHLYAYDLKDLGLYYRMFEQMIEFWRMKTPDWFSEIQYEELIADPETQVRKLIDAAGLEWEDACMNFHENKRRVDTLSVYQVRQPIYKSSMKAWQRYEDELVELFDALGLEDASVA